MPSPPVRPGYPWWRSGVLYQVYPRSFADSNADGVGDLQGVIDHLDHIAWLGVDGIWLTPVTRSPNADWGYDVADYLAVDSELGDLGTIDRLIAEASARDIRVVLDLVPNHTSDRHPWFIDARRSRSAAHRDWYVWSDPAPGGGPPNNWRSVFGGPAWTWDRHTDQYYLHNFLPEQPDLNWWNPEVRDAFEDVLRFWFDRGVAGFRIDVAQGLFHDTKLRDNPPVTDEDPERIRQLGVRPVYNLNRPEVHDIYRRWRQIADAHEPARVLIGETWVLDLSVLATYYGLGGDELDLAMNFPFMFAELGPQLRSVVEATERALPDDAWPTWNGSNHDVGRFPSRWCAGDERKVRAALMLLLTLRGTPILYYGDEIGMEDVYIPTARLLDPVALRRGRRDPGDPGVRGRDGGRTPMRWTAEQGAGFTEPGVEPWLPIGAPNGPDVASQREDPSSVLHLCRDLIALRRVDPALAAGSFGWLDSPPEVLAWRRGAHLAVAINGSDELSKVELGGGRILVGTRRERDGESLVGAVRLEPWEGIVARVHE